MLVERWIRLWKRRPYIGISSGKGSVWTALGGCRDRGGRSDWGFGDAIEEEVTVQQVKNYIKSRSHQRHERKTEGPVTGTGNAGTAMSRQ